MKREVVSYGTRGCLRAAEALLDVLLPTSKLALTFLCADAMRVPVHKCNGFVYGMSARHVYAILIRIEALVPMVVFRPIHSLHPALPSHSPGPTLKVDPGCRLCTVLFNLFVCRILSFSPTLPISNFKFPCARSSMHMTRIRLSEANFIPPHTSPPKPPCPPHLPGTIPPLLLRH
jgi:hypothetical protein